MPPSPPSTPSPAPPAKGAAGLPPADGLIGHLRHTWAAIGLIRAWRAQYQQLDDALRDAVIRRDQRLFELGEAAFIVRATLNGEIGAFALTVDELDVEVSATQAAVRAAEAALSEARSARDAQLDACKAAVDAARGALNLPERALGARVVRRDTLEREVAALGARQGEARARHARLDAQMAALPEDDPDRAALATQVEQVIASTATLATRSAEVRAEHARLVEEVAPLHAKVDQLSAAHAAALDAQRTARQAGDAAVKAAEAELVTCTNGHEQRGRRRRAVIIDLARAVLRAPDVALPERPAAEEAVAAIVTLRDARRAIDAERAAYNGSAARRTAVGVGVVLVGLIILWIAL